MKVVLYDARKDSSTPGELNEFFMGVHNPLLIKIPPLVYHGFKCIGPTEALVISVPTKAYDPENPDKFEIDPYDNDIPYDWSLKEG